MSGSDAAAAVTSLAGIQHRVCNPGQWPQLTELNRAAISELGNIGIPRNAAAVLMAFLEFGQDLQVTSWWLEHVTDARQGEISMALAWLVKEGAIKSEKKITPGGKGRPLKVFVLTCPVDVFIGRRIADYRKEVEARVATLTRLFPGVE